MKKGLYAILLIMLLPMLFCLRVHASEGDNTEYSFGHFYYHIHEGYVSISGYLGRETEITIPSTISGKPVSEIESGAFNGCNTVQVITIPDTVDTVHSDSFTGISSLNKIICKAVGVTISTDSGVEVVYPEEKGKDQGKDAKPAGEDPVVGPIDRPEPDTETVKDGTKSDIIPQNQTDTRQNTSESAKTEEIEQGAYEEPMETPSESLEGADIISSNENPADHEETEHAKGRQTAKSTDWIYKILIPCGIVLLAGVAVLFIVIKRKKN